MIFAPLRSRIALAFCLSLLFCTASAAPSLAAKSAAYVLDATTGKTLYSRHGHARRYPASLTKMMTLYLLFEDLEHGRVTLNTKFKVSKHAASREPSKLWLKPGQTISALDAIHAVVTLSANDAAAVIGEALAGSERKFARRMTKTAHQLGMKHTRFANASGLPNRRQYTTARDMAVLGAALQARFPKHYRYFITRKFAFRGRVYPNHNHLLSLKGVDGIKTGYTRASGFNIVTSVRRGGRKMIVVVMGGPSYKKRDARARQLIKRHFARAHRGKRYYAGLMTAIGRAENLNLEVATTKKPPVDAARLNYSIRIGALPSQAAADRVIASATPVMREVSDTARPLTQKSEVGDKTYFRAIFKGFADLASAEAACTRLKREDFDCYPVLRSADAR